MTGVQTCALPIYLDKKETKLKNFNELSPKDQLIYYLAENTEGYVGADIESLVREAAMLCLRVDINNQNIGLKYFEEAMKKVGASVTKSDMDKYRRIESDYLRSAKAALEKPVEYFG